MEHCKSIPQKQGEVRESFEKTCNWCIRIFKNRTHQPVIRHETPRTDTVLAVVCILLFSAGALAWNVFVTQYPGNSYALSELPIILLLPPVMVLGVRLQFGALHPMTARMHALMLFCVMLTLVLLLTNTVQFTPFQTIDNQLYAADKVLGLDVSQTVTQIRQTPWINDILGFFYDSLSVELAVLPALALIFGRTDLMKAFCFMMLVTGLAGFAFYYFYPTTAPASIINNPYFSEAQRATGIKFTQIHHYITPQTQAGGMISFPSFHVVWALLAMRLAFFGPIINGVLWLYNIIIVLSCVLLGWHYYADILAGASLAGGAYLLWKARRTPVRIRNTG